MGSQSGLPTINQPLVSKASKKIWLDYWKLRRRILSSWISKNKKINLLRESQKIIRKKKCNLTTRILKENNKGLKLMNSEQFWYFYEKWSFLAKRMLKYLHRHD